MRYLISVIDDRSESGTAAEMAAIDVFNELLVAKGHWLLAGGLQAPARSTVIDNRSGKPISTDGPFAETKEFIAGFWIIDAPDRATALQLAEEGSKACNRRVEVRAVLSEPAEVSAGGE
jgi:hypothetical protein